MVQMTAVTQICAAAVQVKMGISLGNGDAPESRVGVKKTAAFPVQGMAEKMNGILRIARILICEPIVLKKVVDAF